MSVSLNVITPQGLEPLQFPTKFRSPSWKAHIGTILQDILALTKLNYNASDFADGTPITLKFADNVGEVLTAGPIGETAPLPFRYYI